MEKTITIQRNKVFFSILLSIFIFSAFFLNYLNVFAADCGGCGQPACPVAPPPTSPPHTSAPRPVSPSSVSGCTCSVIYSNTPCADISCPSSCGGGDDGGGDGYYYYSPSPPPSPPPPVCTPNCSGQECGGDGCGGTCGACLAYQVCSNGICKACQIISFTINGKDNSDQDPLIVWVNALLKGYFSVNDICTSCKVESDDNWNKTYKPLPLSGNVTEQFKINTAGIYSYTLECVGTDPEYIVTDTLSLQTVKAINLPWWREIIPVLPGFLRGLWR